MKEKHIIRFKHYPRDWTEGIPIGNGEVGSIIYGSPSELSFTLGRNSVWDYFFEDPDTLGEETLEKLKKILLERDEKKYKKFVEKRENVYRKPYPCPQTCGRIQLFFPSDSENYLLEFIPEENKVEINFTSIGKKRKIIAFVAPEIPVLFIKILFYESSEKFLLSLNRKGLSEIFYYSEERVKVKNVWNCYPLMIGKFPDGFCFNVGVDVKGAKFKKKNKEEFFVLPEKKEVILAVSVECGYSLDEIYKKLLKYLKEIERYKYWEERHKKEWDEFINTSGVSLPDKFFENLWYTNLSFLNASLRYAKLAPGLFAMWSYNNVPPWHGDYHLDRNFQAVIEPLFKVNHPELAMPHLKLLQSVIPRIRENTKKFYKMKGIAFPGSMGPKGENLGGYFTVSYWEGASAWNSLLFWNLYQYTQDNLILKEMIYPFLKECGEFYIEYLGERKADGKYHIWPSYLPETGANSIKAWGTDSSIDIAFLKVLFGALVKICKILGNYQESKKWEHFLLNLADFPIWDDAIVDYKEWPEYHLSEGIFTDDLRISAIYPAGLIHIDSPYSLKKLGINTFWSLEKHHVRRWLLTDACVAFRLGLIDIGYGYLKSSLSNISPNGVGTGPSIINDGVRKYIKPDHGYSVFGIEFAGNVVSAINEMLLKDCGGIIRVFPSIPKEWKEVSFDKFCAEGGFIISGNMESGKVIEIRVKSIGNKKLKLVNPNKDKICIIYYGGRKIIKSERIIEIDAKNEEEYKFKF